MSAGVTSKRFPIGSDSDEGRLGMWRYRKCSWPGRRISKRRVQILFRGWQLVAGFDRLYPFHALRHTVITNVCRASRDLFLAQRFARHANPMTTVVYTHVSDEELSMRVRDLAC